MESLGMACTLIISKSLMRTGKVFPGHCCKQNGSKNGLDTAGDGSFVWAKSIVSTTCCLEDWNDEPVATLIVPCRAQLTQGTAGLDGMDAE